MANISFTLKYWRQNGPQDKGHFDTREMKDIPTDTSFLEMLDILNEQLIEEGNERPRLPRGHLRYVLTLHQRSPTRTEPGRYHMPALHA